jgi:predicted transcriptional regulator
MEVLNRRRRRAYTSVMSLLNVMTDKGLLRRKPKGRAFTYEAKVHRENTLGELVGDLLGRAFEGSASALLAHLLDQSTPSAEELEEIRRTIDRYRKQQGES